MLSCGSCRMISCATVSPPMPESKTPTGAAFAITPLPLERGRNDGPAVTWQDAKTDARWQVPKSCRDERVGAGEEVIRDEERCPVFDMCTSRANILGREPRRRSYHLRLSVSVEVRDDQCVVLRPFGFVHVRSRFTNHGEADRFHEDIRSCRFVSPEHGLRIAREEKRIEESSTRRDRRLDGWRLGN